MTTFNPTMACEASESDAPSPKRSRAGRLRQGESVSRRWRPPTPACNHARRQRRAATPRPEAGARAHLLLRCTSRPVRAASRDGGERPGQPGALRHDAGDGQRLIERRAGCQHGRVEATNQRAVLLGARRVEAKRADDLAQRRLENVPFVETMLVHGHAEMQRSHVRGRRGRQLGDQRGTSRRWING